mmetsp:Transcript_11523/g.36912  ORF Transcript_11523/g.36912 Transcript_11523/m.36912 type:complete len:274 (-) Transcript_11523:43-864(-)
MAPPPRRCSSRTAASTTTAAPSSSTTGVPSRPRSGTRTPSCSASCTRSRRASPPPMPRTRPTTAAASSSSSWTEAPSSTWALPSSSRAWSARTTQDVRTRRSSTRARLSPPGCGRSRDSSSPLRSGRRSSSSSRRWRGARPSRSISPRRPSPSSASTAGTRCRGGPTQTATARRRATPTPGLWRRRGQPEPTNIYSRARVVSRGEWRGPWIGGQLDQLPHRAASPSHHDEDIRLYAYALPTYYACGESQWTRSRSDVSVVREGRRGTREVWAT